MTNQHEELIRAAFDRLKEGDTAGFLALHADDVVLNYPGRSRFAGEHVGREAVAKLLDEQTELLGGSPPRLEIHDVVANDQHAVALQTFRAERGGRSIEDHSVLVFHFRDGKAADIWIHPQDQYAQDEFWA